MTDVVARSAAGAAEPEPKRKNVLPASMGLSVLLPPGPLKTRSVHGWASPTSRLEAGAPSTTLNAGCILLPLVPAEGTMSPAISPALHTLNRQLKVLK